MQGDAVRGAVANGTKMSWLEEVRRKNQEKIEKRKDCKWCGKTHDGEVEHLRQVPDPGKTAPHPRTQNTSHAPPPTLSLISVLF